MRKILLLYIASIIVALVQTVNAQQNMSLHGVNEVGQSILSNPAEIPDQEISIGVPFLSGISAELAISGFRMNDLLVERTYSDSIDVDIDNVLSLLEARNYSSANLRNDLLFGGIRLGDDYLSFGLASNFNAGFHYPADLLRFLYLGNAGFYDQLLDFSETNLQLNHYMAYHLGYSIKLNEKLRAGVRVKYLRGYSNITFDRFNLQFVQKEDPSEYNRFWFRTDLLLNTSGVEVQNDFTTSDYFSGKNNPGYAFDFGINYQVNHKLEISASVIDLGKIKWQTDVKNYQTKAEGYFEGITLDTGADSVDYYNDFIDSLKTVFDFKEGSQSYTSKLPARYALAMEYKLSSKSEFGLLTGLTDFSGFAEPYLRLSYTHRFSDRILVRGSYGIKNRTYVNIGLGAVVNLGPLQVFAFGDNIAAIFSPWNARMVNVNMGVNILL